MRAIDPQKQGVGLTPTYSIRQALAEPDGDETAATKGGSMKRRMGLCLLLALVVLGYADYEWYWLPLRPVSDHVGYNNARCVTPNGPNFTAVFTHKSDDTHDKVFVSRYENNWWWP